MNQVAIYTGTVVSVDLEHGTYVVETEKARAGGSIALLHTVPSVGDTLTFTVQRHPRAAGSPLAASPTAKGAPRKPGPFLPEAA